MKKIIISILSCLIISNSFAQVINYQLATYVLPSGDTLSFALKDDGTAVLASYGIANLETYAEGGTYRYSVMTQYKPGYSTQNPANQLGTCHYLNEHVSNYNGICRDLVIPSSITFPSGATFTVTEIGGKAFKHQDCIKSIEIPNTVNKVWSDAFFHCRNLETVIFRNGGDSEILIFAGTFAACYSLRKVVLPSHGTRFYGGGVFYDDSIDTVIINGNCYESELYNNMGQTIPFAPQFYHEEKSWDSQDYGGPATALVFANNVREFKIRISNEIGGDTLILPRGMTCLTDFKSSYRHVILPDSLESFGVIQLDYASELTIPDGVDTSIWIHYIVSVNDRQRIWGKRLRKLTIGKNITRIIYRCSAEQNDWTSSIYHPDVLDTIIIRTRKLRNNGMNINSFPRDHNIDITIPCGELSIYREMVGTSAVHLIMHEDTNCNVMVTTQSDNETYGIVEGGGWYPIYSNATLTAIPNEGYQFIRWSNGQTNNPTNIYLTNDSSITAFFQPTTEITTTSLDKYIIYSVGNMIIILGAKGNAISIIDAQGRIVYEASVSKDQESIPINTSGIYFVKVGTLPARKVCIIP